MVDFIGLAQKTLSRTDGRVLMATTDPLVVRMAEAQIHATLAVAQEARLANLIEFISRYATPESPEYAAAMEAIHEGLQLQ